MESQLLPDLTKRPTRRPACYLTPGLPPLRGLDPHPWDSRSRPGLPDNFWRSA